MEDAQGEPEFPLLMSDISNFVQRGTDTMLGLSKVSPVSPVSHGPCVQPITFCNGAALHIPRRHPTLFAIWHLCVPKSAELTSLRGGPFRTIICRLSSIMAATY